MKKRYYNSTTKEWYTEGNSLTRRVNGAVFSGVPSVEQLTDWGFVEWVEPEPTPEELLEKAKQQKIAELMSYDSSTAVNEFTVIYNGATYTSWIDPDKRSNYRGSLEDCELMGVTTVDVPISDQLVPLTVSDARMKLAQIQLYANNCTIVTNEHKSAINNLTTVEEVEEYDFTVGYPPKMVFNLDEQ